LVSIFIVLQSVESERSTEKFLAVLIAFTSLVKYRFVSLIFVSRLLEKRDKSNAIVTSKSLQFRNLTQTLDLILWYKV